MGDSSVDCVDTGNKMVARCVLLLLLASAREQPRGSLLQHHVAFELLMRKIKVWRKYIRMSDYGGETEKGTWLYSGVTVPRDRVLVPQKVCFNFISPKMVDMYLWHLVNLQKWTPQSLLRNALFPAGLCLDLSWLLLYKGRKPE